MSYVIIGFSFLITILLQYGLVSRLPLFSGTMDLVLLFIAGWALQSQNKNFWLYTVIGGFFISQLSAMPFYVPLISYLVIFGIATLIKKRVWQVPIFAMFLIVFIGSLFQHLLYMASLTASGISFDWSTGFTSIALPSILLNILFVIPVYAVIQEISLRIYPLSQET